MIFIKGNIIISKPLLHHIKYLSTFLLMVVFALLSGCSPKNIVVQETPVITQPTNTPQPTRIPTANPIGSLENPIIIAHMVESNSDSIQNLGQPLIENLILATGLEIQYVVYDDAKQAFSDLRNDKIHFIWLQPLTYLAAYQTRFNSSFVCYKSLRNFQLWDSVSRKQIIWLCTIL